MLNLIQKYEGLIFDMDGTLIDTMPAHLEAWQQTSDYFNFPFTKAWLHSLGGMPSYKIAIEINKEHHLSLDPTEVSKFKMRCFSEIENKGEAIACTKAILEHFHGKKKLAVGTGSQRKSALALLKQTELLPKLDAVVTATDVANHKPNPDTFLEAARQLGVSANSCVVFEDTELGKRAAHSGGMDCIMVEGDQLVFYPCPNSK
ncbi:carotenoid dehydrogenase [Vibrio sinaloensis]|uniref:beta-phosphoglucomutase family hydrolase n=1 Tax=Photobacterium sp. (strain ATCC 43367) TaxID=379097 RepID=UPI0005802080|nr:beta-phosphoglucomutase family hydrolase [Vibrio sinaloensis]KIE21396.1 carotenoid dehydrogenase [Vibrio sinaloensis]